MNSELVETFDEYKILHTKSTNHKLYQFKMPIISNYNYFHKLIVILSFESDNELLPMDISYTTTFFNKPLIKKYYMPGYDDNNIKYTLRDEYQLNTYFPIDIANIITKYSGVYFYTVDISDIINPVYHTRSSFEYMNIEIDTELQLNQLKLTIYQNLMDIVKYNFQELITSSISVNVSQLQKELIYEPNDDIIIQLCQLRMFVADIYIFSDQLISNISVHIDGNIMPLDIKKINGNMYYPYAYKTTINIDFSQNNMYNITLHCKIDTPSKLCIFADSYNEIRRGFECIVTRYSVL